MSDKLWAEAENLAADPYDTHFEFDTLSDGQVVCLARNPELPGCKAQGTSIDEAQANLDEARVDYIYALLAEGLPVPKPASYESVTSGTHEATSKTYFISYLAERTVELESIVEDVIQPQERPPGESLQLRVDLAKHC